MGHKEIGLYNGSYCSVWPICFFCDKANPNVLNLSEILCRDYVIFLPLFRGRQSQ